MALYKKRRLNRSIAQIFFIFLISLAASATSHHCFAQAVPDTSLNNIIRDDSVRQKKDSASLSIKNKTNDGVDTAATTAVKAGPFQPNPKKSGLYSALIPGLGQLYNRQYWKIGLVYAAVGVTGYVFVNNLTLYESYRKAYIGRINNPYPTDKYVLQYSTDQLNQLQNDYSRYVDLTVLFGTIEYAIQVLDAITSAHLKKFDISRDISMHVRPVVVPNGVGMGLVLNFKGHPIH